MSDFNIPRELSLIHEIQKKLNNDFSGVKVDLYRKFENNNQVIRISFELELELENSNPREIVSTVSDFWDNLRQNLKLEKI